MSDATTTAVKSMEQLLDAQLPTLATSTDGVRYRRWDKWLNQSQPGK